MPLLHLLRICERPGMREEIFLGSWRGFGFLARVLRPADRYLIRLMFPTRLRALGSGLSLSKRLFMLITRHRGPN